MTVRSSFTPDRGAAASAQLGFTLVELAMVLFIVGLLLAGALIPLTTQMEVRSIAETRRIMDQINEALIGFAQSNGRLPCPALASTPTGTSSAGTETSTCTGTGLVGVIPWATLGVPETDAWGRRFTYRVAGVFSNAIPASGAATSADWHTSTPQTQGYGTYGIDCTAPSPAPTQSSFALCSLGEISALNRSINSAGVHSTSVQGFGLPAVFVSHGKNGYGGYQTNGVQMTGVTTGSDEATNAAGGVLDTSGSATYFQTYIFYNRQQTPYAADCSETVTAKVLCEYDDIVYMISSPTLVARMVSAGRLP